MANVVELLVLELQGFIERKFAFVLVHEQSSCVKNRGQIRGSRDIINYLKL